MSRQPLFTRRAFVKTSLQLCAGVSLSAPLSSLASKIIPARLSFYHTHTGERFRFDRGDLFENSPALTELNVFLRDFRTGDIHTIDPRLLDTLFAIQQRTAHTGNIEIISGYRSPKTNKKLRTKSKGVARKSLHMQGRALDIRLAGLDTNTLSKVAISLGHGGVGSYPKSKFVHIDTGRVRFW